MIRGAIISEDGFYRYTLNRKWDDGPIMNFIMLNPSTADAEVDDRTICRCIHFARREGCGELLVTNLFAWRSTDPDVLKDVQDPVGRDNTGYLLGATHNAAHVVCGWGTKGTLHSRDLWVRSMLQRSGVTAKCLAVTKEGHPKHPLYVSGQQPLMEYQL